MYSVLGKRYQETSPTLSNEILDSYRCGGDGYYGWFFLNNRLHVINEYDIYVCRDEHISNVCVKGMDVLIGIDELGYSYELKLDSITKTLIPSPFLNYPRYPIVISNRNILDVDGKMWEPTSTGDFIPILTNQIFITFCYWESSNKNILLDSEGYPWFHSNGDKIEPLGDYPSGFVDCVSNDRKFHLLKDDGTVWILNQLPISDKVIQIHWDFYNPAILTRRHDLKVLIDESTRYLCSNIHQIMMSNNYSYIIALNKYGEIVWVNSQEEDMIFRKYNLQTGELIDY